LAALLFIFVGVATPITNWPAFLLYFLLIFSAAIAAKLSLRTLLSRAVIEIPFIFFAILMPFFGKGDQVEVGLFNLYVDGIEAALSIVAKGTLGVLTAVILSTSTTAREILRGLERLKLPRMMVQIATFMLRYIKVISDEMERMKVARESRGFEAKGIQHWKILATVAAALFIRSYERGERIHLAMLSRGYAGELPQEQRRKIASTQWLIALSLPATALTIFITTTLLELS
jgi:cobalt/nickel transport system permease protein